MRHVVLTRSAYGPGWDIDANRRRLAMTEGVTVRSMLGQTSRAWTWIVLLHREDALLEERRQAFGGATFLYTDAVGSPAEVAFCGYSAGWAEAIGERGEKVAMTRIDDDDAFAPWAMERIEQRAEDVHRRTALMLPRGVRAWRGGYTFVRHDSNAMQTLVTPPGDAMTVYDYPHRRVRHVAPVIAADYRPAWLWARHPDTISGWHHVDRPLTGEIRAMFPVDWRLLDGQHERVRALKPGRVFR